MKQFLNFLFGSLAIVGAAFLGLFLSKSLFIFFLILALGGVMGMVALYYGFHSFYEAVEEQANLGKIRSNRSIGKFFQTYETEKELLEKTLETLKIDPVYGALIDKINAYQEQFVSNCQQFVFLEGNYGRARAGDELTHLERDISEVGNRLKSLNDKIMKHSIQRTRNRMDNEILKGEIAALEEIILGEIAAEAPLETPIEGQPVVNSHEKVDRFSVKN